MRNAGIDHVLLEGRDRIGGRAHTVDLDGVPIDLGCSWIHDPIGNPLTIFADQAGVARRDADHTLDAVTYRMWDARLGRELDQTEKLAALVHGASFMFVEAGGIAAELGVTASIYDGARLYLDRHGLAGDARRQAEFVIRSLSELSENYPWTKLSLDQAVHRDLLYTGGLGVFPVGGYERLYQAMAGPEPVLLSHEVEAIERSRDGVTVHATVPGLRRRVSFRGSHVIVAVPLGVLKSRRGIRFSPPLPPDKIASIERVGFGRIEKVAMRFDEAFWADALHTHILNISSRPQFRLPLWVDVDRISGEPALVVFSGGSDARRIHALGAPRGAQGDARSPERDPRLRGAASPCLAGHELGGQIASRKAGTRRRRSARRRMISTCSRNPSTAGCCSAASTRTATATPTPTARCRRESARPSGCCGRRR